MNKIDSTHSALKGLCDPAATLAAAVSAARRCRREKAGEPANG